MKLVKNSYSKDHLDRYLQRLTKKNLILQDVNDKSNFGLIDIAINVGRRNTFYHYWILDIITNNWIVDLENIQKKSPSICWCMTVFCFPGFIAQCILCAMFCPTSIDHPLSFLPCYFGDWHGGLRRWQDNVNQTLNKHDLHAKLVTYKPHQNAPKSKDYGMRTAGKDDKYEMSFLLIATDESESLKLQSESWDHGVNDGCTSGIGRAL